MQRRIPALSLTSDTARGLDPPYNWDVARPRKKTAAGPRIARGIAALVVACGVGWTFRDPLLRVGGRLLFPYPFRSEIEREAAAANVDPLLVVAIMREESGFSPRARSRVGAIGLMQLMPHTARWIASRLKEPIGNGVPLDAPNGALYDPRTNIHLGVRYLAYLERHFRGDTIRALAAYNGGEGNVARWHSLAEAYPETRYYVERGLRAYAVYRWLYGPSPGPTAPPVSNWGP